MEPRNAPQKDLGGVYIDSLLTRKLPLKITEIGKNVKSNLIKKLAASMEGKCCVEGYVCPMTIDIVSYSAGLIKDDHVEFHVVFRSMVCNPIKDIEVSCLVQNITKAGIHAHVVDANENVPIIVFIARDHQNMNPRFDVIREDDTIRAKIIGTRFELNDNAITAIAGLM